MPGCRGRSKVDTPRLAVALGRPPGHRMRTERLGRSLAGIARGGGEQLHAGGLGSGLPAGRAPAVYLDVGAQQGAHDLGRRHAVDHGVVHPDDEEPTAVGKPVEEVDLPQRKAEVHHAGHDARDRGTDRVGVGVGAGSCSERGDPGRNSRRRSTRAARRRYGMCADLLPEPWHEGDPVRDGLDQLVPVRAGAVDDEDHARRRCDSCRPRCRGTMRPSLTSVAIGLTSPVRRCPAPARWLDAGVARLGRRLPGAVAALEDPVDPVRPPGVFVLGGRWRAQASGSPGTLRLVKKAARGLPGG